MAGATDTPPVLLAVDLGVRAGLALYGADGRLRWYRSHNFGSPARLRRGASAILGDVTGLAWLVAEGDANLAQSWCRAAEAQGATVRVIGAEAWRSRLLLERELREPERFKARAVELARRVIAWSAAPAPRGPLRHDAAEAILVGLWGVLEAGWLPELPPEVR